MMRYADVSQAMKARLAETPGKERVGSLDALRGFNFVWILGGDGILLALDWMLQGKNPTASAIAHFFAIQVQHVPWEGFRFYDLVFPMFVFITGVAIPLSLPQLVERDGRLRAHVRVLRRVVLLYVLGLIFYGGIKGGWQDIRFLGVLQRIAICYLFAAVLFLNFNWRVLVATFVALLAGYWALLSFVPVPCCGAGWFLPDGNLANFIDALFLPGRLFDRTSDPEGLLSTLPAIATCLAGVFAGLLLREKRVAPQAKVYWLLGAGIVSIAAGYLWSLQFPIIKYLWTSSFVLVTAGWSAVLLGAFYQVVDVWGYRRWATVFVWIGANAILLYCLNGFFGFEPFALRFVGGDFGKWLDQAVTPGAGMFVAHLVGFTFVVMLAGYLYRRKVFLRV